jgi:hypothetical protein
MKKLILGALLLLSTVSFGQCASYNDTIFIHPDTIQNLPPSTKGVYYYSELYFKDSTGSYFNVSPLGLPNGISYKIVCDSGFSKTFIFEGTPKNIGVFELELTININNIAKTMLGYRIIVTESENLNPCEYYEEPTISISPNPANEMMNVSGMSASMKASKITITNVEGKVVANKNIQSAADYGFDLSNVKAGIYLVKIEYYDCNNIKKYVTRRFVKK